MRTIILAKTWTFTWDYINSFFLVWSGLFSNCKILHYLRLASNLGTNCGVLMKQHIFLSRNNSPLAKNRCFFVILFHQICKQTCRLLKTNLIDFRACGLTLIIKDKVQLCWLWMHLKSTVTKDTLRIRWVPLHHVNNTH